jgi:signal transduction histidine kinase
MLDITERKLADQALKESEKKLVQLNADKDRFIAILGHDLRSPFNGLLGLSALLKENIQNFDIEEIKNYAGHINKTAQSTFNLLENILLWARTQQGIIHFKLQKLQFQDIFKNIHEVLNPTAIEKNITIKYSATDHLTVFADANMLKTVLRNLTSNAIKFTNSGGTINISAVQTPSTITISVSDNGVGISQDMIAKLFELGQVQSTNGTANEKGTGFGLLLCKEFVEKHNGNIWVESAEGKGTTFTFTIPNKYKSSKVFRPYI